MPDTRFRTLIAQHPTMNPQLAIPTAAGRPACRRSAVRVHGEGRAARCHESSPRSTNLYAAMFSVVDINSI
jgi:hypothetical protein